MFLAPPLRTLEEEFERDEEYPDSPKFSYEYSSDCSGDWTFKEKERERCKLLTMSELRSIRSNEFQRRREQLRKVEEDLGHETVLRDVLLSVRISVDSEERVTIGSSSVMLSLVSEYFHALFEGDTIEKGETIELSDKVTLQGMLAVNALAFGALNEVQVTCERLVSLIVAALYFEVPALTDICDRFIIESDIFSDISLVSEMIVEFDCLGFTKVADEWMAKVPEMEMSNLFMDPNALEMSADLLKCLLKSDELGLEETEIWYRCVDWARYQADMDDDDDEDAIGSYLCQIKSDIRFSLMTEEFIDKEIRPLKVLSSEELTHVWAVRQGEMHPCKLFCSSKLRANKYQWNKEGIERDYHFIGEQGSLLKHFGVYHWANAFVKGVILNRGTSTIEFQKLGDSSSYYGLMEATEQPKIGDRFGYPLRGVGYYGGDGNIYYPPLKHKSIGETLGRMDRIRVTVTFSNPSQASVTFHKNGSQMGRPIQLDELLDLSKGLKFAVQTYKGRMIRICHKTGAHLDAMKWRSMIMDE